jgi:tetratricopeptide (TPR) repeat protein
MWEETSIRLDSWKATWNQQASLLCPEVRNGKALPPFEPEVREQSRACLHESLTQIGTLLDLWTRASARQVLDASTALLTIVDPVRCLDAQYLRKRTPLPLDPLERRAITEIDAEIAGARVLSDQEDSEEAQRKIDRIALGIAKFGHLPSWARLGAVVSHLSTRTRSIFELAPHHRAILLGIASNQTHLAADATESLWFLQVYAAGHLEMSEEILGYHLALVQRAGYPLELEDGLERNRWIRRLIDGDFAASMPHVLRTAAINYEKYGEISIPYARSLYDVGLSEGRLFDYRAALNDYQKSLDILAAILPKGHPIRSRSALGVAMALGKLNRVDESREILLEAWRECSEAGLAAIACAEFSRVLADEELRTGNLQAALEISAMVDGIERAENRRIDVTEPWTQERVGYILACRGEGEAGVAWAKAGYERLRSEPSVHPSANLRGVLDLGRTCFAAHDLSCARANLDAAEQIFAAQNGEFSVHERSSLMALRGRVLTAEHRYTPALVALEEALAVAEDNREPAIDRVSHHLDLAKAWHGLGDLAMALHHANLALELEHASRGVLGHRAWPVHALLAELWHASGEMNEALHHIEMVEKIFDRRQEDSYPREPFGQLKAKLRQLAR